jgi:5'-nucleotidase
MRKTHRFARRGHKYGANAGINVYYSGTVAAAMEGVLLGIPSVATSAGAEENMDFAQAAKYCVEILKGLMPIELGALVNINIPVLSMGKPKGIRVVPQSNKAFDEYYVPQTDEKGRTVYQLAGGPHPLDDAQTDTVALMEGFISVSALAPDMTDYKRTKHLRKAIAKLNVSL